MLEAQHLVQVLDEQCYEGLRSEYRPGSFKNLRAQAHIYFNFCKTHNLRPLPADEWQMVRFSRYIGNTVSFIYTIQNYNGGVRKLHSFTGYEANYQLIIQSLKAELAKPTKQAIPITPQILREIYDQVDWSQPIEVVCYMALLVRFTYFYIKVIWCLAAVSPSIPKNNWSGVMST